MPQATIHSKELIDYKLLTKYKHVPDIITDIRTFKHQHVLLKVAYIILQVHMDKLMYLVIKTDENLHVCTPLLDDSKLFPLQDGEGSNEENQYPTV